MTLYDDCEWAIEHNRRIRAGVQKLFTYEVIDSFVARQDAVKLLERINNNTPFHAIVKLNKKSGKYDVGVRNMRRK